MYLTRTEAGDIEQRTDALEAHAGVQVVTALVGKADVYAELPWRAFALGTVLAALAAVIADWLRPVGARGTLFLLGTCVIGYPIAKLILSRTEWYAKAAQDMKTKGTTSIGGIVMSSGGSSGGSSSGGGGSSGGGSSGSW